MPWLPRFIRVLSKIEVIQNGGFKKANGSSFFFTNEWRHHDITAVVKIVNVLANFLILSESLLLEFFRCMATLRGI